MFVSYRNFKEHCEDSDKSGIQNRSWKLCHTKKMIYVGYGKGEGHHNLCFITRTLTVRTKAEIMHALRRFKKGSEMST